MILIGSGDDGLLLSLCFVAYLIDEYMNLAQADLGAEASQEKRQKNPMDSKKSPLITGQEGSPRRLKQKKRAA